MTAIVTGYKRVPSKHGDFFYHIFFKTFAGVSFLTHAYPKHRNFKKWKKVISAIRRKEEVILYGLEIRSHNVIDADSPITRELP